MRHVDYRQFNYSEMMYLKSHLARWLYKRLAHYCTNAGLTKPIKLSFGRMDWLVCAKRRDKRKVCSLLHPTLGE
jgi:hypothetical protein